MTMIEELGKVEDNAVQEITIEVVCHSKISGEQFTKVIDGIKIRLGEADMNCNVARLEDQLHVTMSTKNTIPPVFSHL